MSKQNKPKENVCRDCRYFIMHYILWPKFDKYMPYDGGHCIRASKPKNRTPGRTACENFEERCQKQDYNILCTVSCWGKG